MRRLLVFDCINTDTLIFNSGETIPAGQTYRLFLPEDKGVEDKAADESEEQILRRFMSDSGCNLLPDKLHLSRSAVFDFSVRKPVVENPNHSDIDLMVDINFQFLEKTESDG